MLCKLIDETLETLAIFRQAARIYIHQHRAVKIIFIVEGKVMAETLVLKDDQKVSFTIQIVDAKGNPAQVDGAPVWASSNEAILKVEAAADGMSAVATAVGPLGPSQISVTADADLGSGIKSIVGTQDVEVVAGEAVAVGIVAGAPEQQ